MRRNILQSRSVKYLTPNQSSLLSFLSFHRLLRRSKTSTASPRLESDDPPFSPIIKTPNPKPELPPKTLVSAKGKTPTPFHSDLAFDFRFSYSETDPAVKPMGFREPPRFSPFGPGRLDRKWNGVSAPAVGELPTDAAVEEQRRSVIGEPLTEVEVEELVERYQHSDCSRQINLGSDGVTHNMMDDIHNHWKRAEAVRIKCLGVPTLDMDNVCFHLEDKTSGKVIYRNINTLLLYRGRNYDPENRPVIPLMLWKPQAPIYPRLVKNVADGLTFEETKALRSKGLNSLPLMKLTRACYAYADDLRGCRSRHTQDLLFLYSLTHVFFSFILRDCNRLADPLANLTRAGNFCWMDAAMAPPEFCTLLSQERNGVYVNVVERVRQAFETLEVLRLDCAHVGSSNCKKIGVKLRDLVPCVPILFKDEQIILWRGKSAED